MIEPHPALPFVRQAEALRLGGRHAEAAAAYAGLLAKWPDLPDSWFNLAVVQRQLGRAEAALASYQQALDRGVAKPEEVHLNRSVIYADILRRDDAAEAELERALELNHDYVPAILNLANLKEQRGDRASALSLYERILSRDPRCFDALARYAGLRSVENKTDAIVADLRAAIAGSASTPAEKANLGFALGRLLDGCGAYGEAFEAYVAANRHSRESASRMPPYNRRREERFVDELTRIFAPNGVHAAASSAPPPVFICGMFRSGSTLAEQVLASHPRVTPGGELNLIPAFVQSEFAPFPAAFARTTAAKLEAVAQRYRERLAQMFPGADIVTDKRPDNFLYVGLIKALFPDARIVNTIRNPLDNCLSVYFLHLDHGMPYALDLIDTAHYYRQYRRLMAHWKSLYGADILDFDYDAFVQDPRPATERLLAFCGLEWDEACMSFHRAKNVVKTESVWQVREPLYRRSSGRWRNYAEHLDRLRAYLGELADG